MSRETMLRERLIVGHELGDPLTMLYGSAIGMVWRFLEVY